MPRSNDDGLIPERDVRKIVRLLGVVAGRRGSLTAKRRALMVGLTALIDADAWSWIVSRASRENDNPAVSSFLYGGLSDEQFARYAQIMQDRRNTPVEYKALNQLRLTHKRFTRSWDQLVSKNEWYGPKNQQLLMAVGFEHVMYCVRVLDDDGLFSGIALKRKVGRPNFTPIQRRIAHIVTGEIEWLHHDESAVSTTRKVRPLSPQLRTVLTLRVNGLSVRQIAERLSRSYYTINDYMKDIHSHFKVNSHAELLRHFMDGDGGDLA